MLILFFIGNIQTLASNIDHIDNLKNFMATLM